MKRSALALAVGAAVAARACSKSGSLPRAVDSSSLPRDAASQQYMMYVGLPAWALAGAVDWYCHRQTKIETTSGPKESIMHLLMMAESGISVFAGLFLRPNAGMFSMMTAGMLLHQATVIWDVGYTAPRRKISTFEQHTHTFMETLPFDILGVFACMHPQEFRSMLGLGPGKPDFSLRLRRPKLSMNQIAAVFGVVTMVSAIPHVEELWRCWRAR
ncbi:MAG: hypothetical protein ACXVZV_05595, partial [Terriglobales bacterium]